MRSLRFVLLIPIVALAILFDRLSAAMHDVADRVARVDEKRA